MFVYNVTEHLQFSSATCLEKDFYVLARRLLFEDGVRALSHHVVDGLHDVQHFLQCTEKQMKITQKMKTLKTLKTFENFRSLFSVVCGCDRFYIKCPSLERHKNKSVSLNLSELIL